MADNPSANRQPPPHSPARREAEVWLTTTDQSCLFQRQAPLAFADAGHAHPGIQIDPAREYQAIDGFGFALTGGSAYLLNRLPAPAKQTLLRQLFLPEDDGIGISLLRISIGASDLSASSFSYDDLPPDGTTLDLDLARFDLAAGDADVVPLLKEILAINPDIKIIATPWSAPPWMKTNGSFIGGELRLAFYPVYARYFVKYLQAMAGHGIAIHAIAPQNEPLNHKNEPSMVMAADAQADFIKNHLGPALRDAGLEKIEIFCWDHNCDGKDYPLAVLADPDARHFVTGVAWHLYAGDIGALSEVHQAYPDMKMYFTEQWVGTDGQFAGDLRWHMKNVMIGAARNWSRAVLEWNLASRPYHDPVDNVLCHGPHTPGGERRCVGALAIADGEIARNVAYYVIAHAAKCVRPGSMRIFSDVLDALPNVAFKTPGGDIVLIALNDGQAAQTFAIHYDGASATASLAEGAVGTYVWPA